MVMFLFREEYYDPAHSRPGETEVIVRKHRNGELGTVILRFDQKTLLFAPLDQQAPGYPYS
ncbi:MAG: hypothetical protein KatS3mg115_0738 [Candidatus Poribacteria bacterium]|nr:MAG: hypothetical protein KatS3mg115_0738 [Candidatus Poribacteria bacterium]